MNDPLADALERTFTQRADDAPDASELLGAVRAGRRRRRRRAWASAVACVVVAAFGVLWFWPSADPQPVAPPVMRTYAYDGVEVRVPADWSVRAASCSGRLCQTGFQQSEQAAKAVEVTVLVEVREPEEESLASKDSADMASTRWSGRNSATLRVDGQVVVIEAADSAALQRALRQIQVRPTG